jgi:hypothetical protein
MLSNLFRINFPYGIAKTGQNKWYFFNREYMPLGVPDVYFKNKEVFLEQNAVGYKNLTINSVLNIVKKYDPKNTKNNTSQSGETIKIFFYNDGTNPCHTKNFKPYFNILEELSMFNKTNI